MGGFSKLLLVIIAIVLALGSASAADSPAPEWDPENTRVVVISLARFAGEKDGATSFSIPDRLDDPLVELFQQ